MIFHFPCSWLFWPLLLHFLIATHFRLRSLCHWYHSYFWKDQTSTLLQHWVSDCALYDGGSGWVVLQIRRRRRGQQLINNPGDRLIAVPRTSSTRYPCTTPVPMYLLPCTSCTSYPAPCTVYPMYLPVYPDVPSYPWRKPILLPLDLDPLLSSLVGQLLRIIESIRQLPRHSGQ